MAKSAARSTTSTSNPSACAAAQCRWSSRHEATWRRTRGVQRALACWRLAVLQERRDVDLVLADLERRALHVVHRDLSVAAAVAALAGRPTHTRAGSVVLEPGRDHRDPDLFAERVIDHGAEDDVR